MEIERKWLLRRIPTVESKSKHWVEQFYLSFNPEIRLRRSKPNDGTDGEAAYKMTLKSDGTLSRVEVETAVSEEFYNQALDLIDCEAIQKHHLKYDVNGREVEVNVILNGDKFIYSEVEFDSEEEALAYQFPWPDLVEREVTYDPNYKMKNRWKALQDK